MRRCNYINVLLITFCLCGMLYCSCNDIIDKNLANATLKIDNPPDSFVTGTYSVVFLWETVTGAGGYHLQIAQPNFNSIQTLVLDTLVSGNKFTYALSPGAYQWRLRAENGSSYTPYIIRSIKVDSNSNLNGQTFVVLAPGNNFITNNQVVTFSWARFPYANMYEYVLLDSTNNTLHSKYTYFLTLTDTIPEGKYMWQARAFDTANGTTTQFSIPSILIIDLTSPSPASPQSPLNNSIDTNAVTLAWSQPADVYADSLLVSGDSTFQSTLLNTYLVNKTFYLLAPLATNRTYYWKLKSRDLAGNWSGYSTVFTFILH